MKRLEDVRAPSVWTLSDCMEQSLLSHNCRCMGSPLTPCSCFSAFISEAFVTRRGRNLPTHGMIAMVLSPLLGPLWLSQEGERKRKYRIVAVFFSFYGPGVHIAVFLPGRPHPSAARHLSNRIRCKPSQYQICAERALLTLHHGDGHLSAGRGAVINNGWENTSLAAPSLLLPLTIT